MYTLASISIWLIFIKYFINKRIDNILIYNIILFILFIFIFSYFSQFFFQVLEIDSQALLDHKYVAKTIDFLIAEQAFFLVSIFFTLLLFFLIRLAKKYDRKLDRSFMVPKQIIRYFIILLVFSVVVIKLILTKVYHIHVPGVEPIGFPGQGIVVYSQFAIILIGIPLIYEMKYKKIALILLLLSFGIDILSGWRGQLILLIISLLILMKFDKKIKIEVKYFFYVAMLILIYALTEPLLLSIRNPAYDIRDYDFISSVARFFYRIIGYDGFLYVYDYFLTQSISFNEVIAIGGPVKYFTFIIEGVPAYIITESTPGLLGNFFILFNYFSILISTILIYFLIRIQLLKIFYFSPRINGYILVHLLFYFLLGNIIWSLRFLLFVLIFLFLFKILTKVKF